MQFKNLQEYLSKAKKDIQEKYKALKQSSTENVFLRQQLEIAKDSLIEAKQMIWDHLIKDIKKVIQYLVELEYERELATTCLANVSTIQESFGDKPLQALNASNYLNTRTKEHLSFEGIQDRS